MTIFNFPYGVDSFTPNLLNDITVVNANHVLDLRTSILLVENAIIGSTPFNYDNVSLIQDGYNLKTALEILDQNIAALQVALGFTLLDGYASRIDALEFGLNSHRIENSWIDSDGYSVHGLVTGSNVVGTLDAQSLQNKRIDSGLDPLSFGPKFVARAIPADIGFQQDMIQVLGVDGYTPVATINYRGDAYFAGDVIVEGYQIFKGQDIIQNSLTVDGSTTLGNNSALDSTTINGNTSIDGTLSITGNLTQTGSNVSLGNNTGSLNLDFNLTTVSQDLYVQDDFSVDGGATLGAPAGLVPHLIRGSVYHSAGVFHSTGEFRALGTKFRVEGNNTYIETNDVFSTADIHVGGLTHLFTSGSITSDGIFYQFGDAGSSSTNTFLINAQTSIAENLQLTGNLLMPSSTAIINQVTTSSLSVVGPLQIQDGSQGIIGHVWTSTDTLGNGSWQPPSTFWKTVIVDGYNVQDLSGTTPLTPIGAFNALSDQELFIRTDAYGSFTINLPSNPILGQRVRFIDFNGSWSPTSRVFVFPSHPGVIKTFIDADVNIGTNEITIPNHGLVIGQRGLLSSTGTLPTPLNLSSYVYVIVININTIQLASSLDDALSNIPIDITSAIGGGTHTFTSGTIMGGGFLELDVPDAWVELVFNGTSWRIIA
jgi:hypothetical protein